MKKIKLLLLSLLAFVLIFVSGFITLQVLRQLDIQKNSPSVAKNKVQPYNDFSRYTNYVPTARSVLDQPFSSDSIWNMPIGDAAHYIDAKLTGTPGNDVSATMPYADHEYMVFKPDAPMTPIYYSEAGWTGQDRCKPSSNKVLATVPMPEDLVMSSDGQNNIGVFLLPDNRTIAQLQPLARCKAGGDATALVNFSKIDIYDDGTTGAHGGSNLSGFGGSLRVGELKKGGQPPRHALKINVYASEFLAKCQKLDECYRWPALTADNYATQRYGTFGTDIPNAMRMGALLALPKSLSLQSLQLQTEPARQLAWTLQHFGAYIVDDTYSPGVGFSVQEGPEGSFTQQFRADYGYDFLQKVASDNPWRRDVQTILKHLKVVDDNAEGSVGGQGVRLTPKAPELVQPDS